MKSQDDQWIGFPEIFPKNQFFEFIYLIAIAYHFPSRLSASQRSRPEAEPLSLFDLLRVAQIRVFRLNIVGAPCETWGRRGMNFSGFGERW